MSQPRHAILIALVLMNVVLFGVFVYYPGIGNRTQPAGALPAQGNYPETALLQGKQGFKEISDFFKDIAQKKGGAYAYEVLRVAPLPLNLDLHLLGHVVGDELYKQQGLNGIAICTPEFRNACSHTIVVGLLLDKGVSALSDITEACHKAPGGSGAYTMCFHGLGHGVLAYTDYDLPKAVELCEKTGTEAYGKREYIECVGGAIMEIISGGGHSPELWGRQSKKYLTNNDPLAPCNADFMPEMVRGQCYTYLTPHLFKAAGADLSRPSAQYYEKAFGFCAMIPESAQGNRSACYGGFGKEFVVLTKDRDIRSVDTMTDQEIARIYEWCAFAKNRSGITECVNSAASSIYWGGENKRSGVILFCSGAQEEGMRAECFNRLINAVRFYVKDPQDREAFCGEIPVPFTAMCRMHMDGLSQNK